MQISHLYPLATVWLWLSHVTILYLSFLIYKEEELISTKLSAVWHIINVQLTVAFSYDHENDM